MTTVHCKQHKLCASMKHVMQLHCQMIEKRMLFSGRKQFVKFWWAAFKCMYCTRKFVSPFSSSRFVKLEQCER